MDNSVLIDVGMGTIGLVALLIVYIKKIKAKLKITMLRRMGEGKE